MSQDRQVVYVGHVTSPVVLDHYHSATRRAVEVVLGIEDGEGLQGGPCDHDHHAGHVEVTAVSRVSVVLHLEGRPQVIDRYLEVLGRWHDTGALVAFTATGDTQEMASVAPDTGCAEVVRFGSGVTWG